MVSANIGACGDLHADYDLLDVFLKKALEEKVDVILLPGDFCNGRTLPDDATNQDFIDQFEPFNKIFAKTTLPIFFILGNHDPIELVNELDPHQHIKYIHGINVEWNGYKVGGIGGSHYVTPQLQNKTVPFPEGRFPILFNNTPDLEHLATTHHENAPYLYSGVHLMYDKVFPCDILISHTPPLLPNKDNYHEASLGLYSLITKYKPLLSISAHVHETNTEIETISWKEKDNNTTTMLVNLGSLKNNKICLIKLSKEEKLIEQIEMLAFG